MFVMKKTCAMDSEIREIRVIAQNREERETLLRLWDGGITMSAVNLQTKTKITIEFGEELAEVSK